MWWHFTLAGLLVGALVGMTGMGGGSLMTPILVILFGVNPAVAVGSDIAHGAIFKTVGAFQHRRMGNVRAQLAGWMLLGSAPMSLLGVWLANWLQDTYGDGVESTMGRVLGGALLFGCVGLVAKSFVHAKSEEAEAAFVLTNRDRAAAVLIGLFGGFVVGLTSVGSGVFFGLTLLVIFPLRAHKVVGTDIFHAAALLYVAGIGHWVAGNVDMHIGVDPGHAAPVRAGDRAWAVGPEADRRPRDECRDRRHPRHRDDGPARLHRAPQLGQVLAARGSGRDRARAEDRHRAGLTPLAI
jgi:uncharacterized membrane protein YfcA